MAAAMTNKLPFARCPGEYGHRLVNIEHINSEGKKFGLKHGQRKDVYHRFGDDAWTVYICEGWATGASLYQIENQSVRVYSAMGKGNLVAVASIALEQNPDSRLILAADNDTHLPNNPGLNDALKAAEAVGATVMLPPAIVSNTHGTDFSDFYLAKWRARLWRSVIPIKFLLSSLVIWLPNPQSSQRSTGRN